MPWLAGLVLALPAWSQDQIYRCGNEYLNDARVAQTRGCQLLEGGLVTTVPGTQVARPPRGSAVSPAPPASGATASSNTALRVDPAQQRARDQDARVILQAELQKAQARLVQQQKEFNGGEPDKQGIEGRNHQRYLDRVSEMREALVRHQADVASLQRELARLPALP